MNRPTVPAPTALAAAQARVRFPRAHHLGPDPADRVRPVRVAVPGAHGQRDSPGAVREFRRRRHLQPAGSIALGFIHPIATILTSVFAVGFSTSAVAGERQRGTLEVALARPIARRTFYLTVLAAAFTFVAITITALLTGSSPESFFAGVADQLVFGNVPLLWLNGVLLFGSFAAIGLAASVSLDRIAPALGLTLGIVVVSYALEILGSLWPAAEFLQRSSLFHYLKPKIILLGATEWSDFALLALVTLAAMAWALAVFPRRDLAAPS